MDEINKLFEYVKKQKWDDFAKSLNENIDFNIKDQHSNYLIQYIILYNNVQMLDILLKYNVTLDWIDNEGRSILYLPIKYGYIEIIKLLLKYDEDKIGVSIANIKDAYGNFPLHYALFFKNLEIFTILSQKNSLFIFDRNKNSIIHLITKNKDINFLKIPLDSSFSINLTNGVNETPLHIASVYDLNIFIKKFIDLGCDVNIKEKTGGLTPLMICTLNNNNQAIDYILENAIRPDLNLQDYEGNTVLHLAIIDNNFETINKIIKQDLSLNLNICNLEGNTPLHIVLAKIFYDQVNPSNYPIDVLIRATNLNIQNNDGQTCWHFIIGTKLFVSDTHASGLKLKKNNLFILDKKNKTPYDIALAKCTKGEQEQLMEIIVSSYLNNLKSTSSDLWTIDWEKVCSKPDSNKDKCIAQIKKHINENKVSIPLKKKNYCIDIENPKFNTTTTFTGIILDIITCYIVLVKKHSNLETSITTDFIENQNVSSYYKKIGIVKELAGDYLNFELFWIFHKDIWPTNIEKTIYQFIKSDKKMFALPIGIDLENGSHANVIIIDKELKLIERFEPSGSDEPIGFNYNKNLLDFKIKTYFEKFFPDYKYLEPKDYLPLIGFQTLEMVENKKMKRIGDPGGFCVGWCLWYLEQRLKYLVHPKILVKKLIINIKSKNISFKNLIRSYVNSLLYDFRDKILNEINIDINDIINENISETKSKELEKVLGAQISSL